MSWLKQFTIICTGLAAIFLSLAQIGNIAIGLLDSSSLPRSPEEEQPQKSAGKSGEKSHSPSIIVSPIIQVDPIINPIIEVNPSIEINSSPPVLIPVPSSRSNPNLLRVENHNISTNGMGLFFEDNSTEWQRERTHPNPVNRLNYYVSPQPTYHFETILPTSVQSHELNSFIFPTEEQTAIEQVLISWVELTPEVHSNFSVAELEQSQKQEKKKKSTLNLLNPILFWVYSRDSA
ncbi:MAG: hypothetical protein AB4290_01770 [Spirulina sp.]